MNRINKLFKEKRGKILSIYFTAGYPSLNDTTEIIKTLDEKPFLYGKEDYKNPSLLIITFFVFGSNL